MYDSRQKKTFAKPSLFVISPLDKIQRNAGQVARNVGQVASGKLPDT